jgi:hypothetical protein
LNAISWNIGIAAGLQALVGYLCCLNNGASICRRILGFLPAKFASWRSCIANALS